MDWVCDGIAIASRSDVVDHGSLEAAGIEAVLQLYGPEPDPLDFPFTKEVLQLRVIDGEPLPWPLLRKGVVFLQKQQAQARRALVTCGAGMSRSPSFVAAFLHEQGMDLAEAFVTLIQRRPQILPHPALLRSLVEHYQLPTTAEALLVQLVKARKLLPASEPHGIPPRSQVPNP